jgi:glutathione synthase/RimK-type ligase-like ATP-grasp enzyme
MKPIIFPYNLGSQGARELARALGTIRVRANGTYRPRNGHIIVNWGNSESATWAREYARTGHILDWINTTPAVGVAADKLRTFQRLSANLDIPLPRWATNRAQAEDWFREGERVKVVCRTLLRASEGRGIVVAKNAEELVAAPLYVKFFPKETEYRVHVFNGEVIDVAEKRLRNGERNREGRSPYIRSHANGWIFARENVRLSDAGRTAALQAISAIGLTFGAVDLAVNRRGEVVVFEVNTAPGIEGQTVTNYASAIRRYCDNN